jgi:hypothetical protein
LYDSKFLQHPGKIRMHWSGPYEVKTIMDGGDVKLKDFGGMELKGMINGIRLKLYRDNKKNKKKTEGLPRRTSKEINKHIVRRKEKEHVHSKTLAIWRKYQ